MKTTNQLAVNKAIDCIHAFIEDDMDDQAFYALIERVLAQTTMTDLEKAEVRAEFI